MMRTYFAKEGARRRARTLALALSLILLLPASAFASHRDDDDDDNSNSNSGSAKALVLYDTSGNWGWMGEKYAIATANLSSRFGTWTAKPMSEYRAGEMASYTAAIYVGSTYDEPIPTAFLDDTLAGRSKVLWMGWNIWQLSNRAGTDAFTAQYGWKDGFLTDAEIPTVTYKGRNFTRNVTNRALMNYHHLDTSKVTVLATANASDGSSVPWALQSGNLTYIGEVPYSFMSETDRYLIAADLLFDLLAPGTPERHRAMVRLEDVGCDTDPDELDEISDYLRDARIPYSFGVYPVYKDPRGVDNNGRSQTIRLRDRECRDVLDEIKDMVRDGGTMIMHGYTHQLDSGAPNPYNGKSGDDFEFFMSHIDSNDFVQYDGPVPGDSFNWALGRVAASAYEFSRAGLTVPKIFEFPHYAASAQDYRAIGSVFSTRYERTLYFNRLIRPGAVDSGKFMGQFFPYVVKDVYGTKVLPENIGNIEPVAMNHHPVTTPADLIERARLNLAVRDGFASFFYHPSYGVDSLRQTIEGIRSLGYTFVSSTSL